MGESIHFEDVEVGGSVTGGTTVIDRDEMVAFAKAWDPLPFHVDEAAARAAFGGLTAPGLYMLAVKQRLIHGTALGPAVIASLGYDELRFHRPARPGDALTLVMEWVEKRESRSKPDRGIVTVRLSLVNQANETVMSHLDTILLRRRTPAG